MKRLLLWGTLLAVASLTTGCMTCGGGYHMFGMAPMNCYSTCNPCMTGVAMTCPTKYVSPYAGQYYQGDECGSPCGGCSSGCGSCSMSYQPFARLCNLLSLGGNSCGCACESYYGDYINNPPSLCNPCDQFGGLAGFSAQCSGGGCGGCGDCGSCYGMSYGASYSSVSSGLSMPYAPVSQPMVQPTMMSAPRSDCKDCNKGNTFYTSQQVRPQPQMQPMPVRQNMMAVRTQVPMQQQLASPAQQPVIIAQSRRPHAQPVTQQPVLQDNLVSVGNPQQINYRMQPVRQVAVRANDQFGTKSKVIQPAVIPTNGRVVHAR